MNQLNDLRLRQSAMQKQCCSMPSQEALPFLCNAAVLYHPWLGGIAVEAKEKESVSFQICRLKEMRYNDLETGTHLEGTIKKTKNKAGFRLQKRTKCRMSKGSPQKERNVHIFSIMEETCACVQNISENYHSCIKPMNAAKANQAEPLYSLLSDTAK